MLRSIICPDIEEDDDFVESEDKELNGSEIIQKEDYCTTCPSVSEQPRENKTKFVLENAQKRLRYLKSLHSEKHQSEARNRNMRKTSKFGYRKRKVDLGDTSVIVEQKTRTNTVEKPIEKAKDVSSKSSDSSNKSIFEMVARCSKRPSTACKKEIVLDHLAEQDFTLQEVYDPHGIKKSKIEKDLDEAIKQSDFNLAQKISDEISERQLSEKIANNFKACTYLEKKKVELEAKDNQKKKLRWMFDHKERWELKGNM